MWKKFIEENKKDLLKDWVYIGTTDKVNNYLLIFSLLPKLQKR